MSELKKKLMDKIESEDLKMRSRSFFVFTKALVEIALVALIVSAIYLINLAIYLPKRGLGPMRPQAFRLNMLLDIVPWNYLLFGAVGLGISFWLLYRFTGTYKKHFFVVITVISVLVLISGALLAFSNLNERAEKRPRLRGLYMMDDPRLGPGQGMMRGPGYLK